MFLLLLLLLPSSFSLSARDFYCYEPYLFTKTELGHAAAANTHTHHGRSKTLTISGEKKVLRTGKKAATKRASSLSGVQPLRGFKRSEKPKKKTITQKHKICAEIRCREKAKEKGKNRRSAGFQRRLQCFGSPHVSVPDFASSFSI
jgi:hypothetical protein